MEKKWWIHEKDLLLSTRKISLPWDFLSIGQIPIHFLPLCKKPLHSLAWIASLPTPQLQGPTVHPYILGIRQAPSWFAYSVEGLHRDIFFEAVVCPVVQRKNLPHPARPDPTDYPWTMANLAHSSFSTAYAWSTNWILKEIIDLFTIWGEEQN